MNTLLINLSFSPIIFISIFFLILFLQSGVDKIMDFGGNLNYFTTHFKNTIFEKFVFFLLLVLTFLECVTGLSFLFFLLDWILIQGMSNYSVDLFYFGLQLSTITICALFLGQRLAKDYVGAVNLSVYFLITLIGFLFLFISK